MKLRTTNNTTYHQRILVNFATFPLTLTLSPEERGQQRTRLESPDAAALPQRWVRFTLSPGERAGVRGNRSFDHPPTLNPE